MDQNKNTQGQQGQGQPHEGQQSQPTRDQAEGSRDKSRSNMGSQERSTGSQSEKNRGGISNRDMSPDEEQLDVPSHGSSDDDFQSER